GSDLLLHRAYLDLKLANCRFCTTISDFNRRFLLQQIPQVKPEKILVCRMGVESREICEATPKINPVPFILLTVGRLHPLKGHAFLIHACHDLKLRGLRFQCLIAGEGGERPLLEKLISNLGLDLEVTLLGHLTHAELDRVYAIADLVVLTSRSEGIPLVL